MSDGGAGFTITQGKLSLVLAVLSIFGVGYNIVAGNIRQEAESQYMKNSQEKLAAQVEKLTDVVRDLSLNVRELQVVTKLSNGKQDEPNKAVK